MPSEFPGYFPIAYWVEKGAKIHSGQQVRVARAINARILSGLGDMHWRCLWSAYSLFRNLRNPSSGGLYAAEDEAFQLYLHYPETVTNFPTAAVGDPEGLNTESAIVAYFFGEAGLCDSEPDRLNSVPLRDPPIVGSLPTTVLEIWDLGKIQRGAVLPSDLTDFSAAPAMFAAREMETANSSVSARSYFHKTAGGKIQDSSDDWIREKGQQWNQMRNQFLTEFRGTEGERSDNPYWGISQLAVHYEAIFESQWFLAPAYGEATGSGGATVAEYPLFDWPFLATAGTYGVYTKGATPHSAWSNRTGFSFVGFILVGDDLGGDVTVDLELDGEVFHSLTVTVAEPEASVWFPAPYKGELKCKLTRTLVATEDVFVEVAELMDHKPEVYDVYTFARLQRARSNSPTIYRGNIISDAGLISDSYFENGMALNGTNAVVPTETKIAKHPQYQAIRDFVNRWFRIITYKQLKGYYVDNGDSVLVFDRFANGDTSADIFRGMCPSESAVTKIQEGVWYHLKETGPSPSGTVAYDGKTYEPGDSFRGTFKTTFTYNSQVDFEVHEKFFLVDLKDIEKTGESNEWILSILGQTTLRDTTGATYKPDAYGNVLGAFHDRCHTFSSSMDGATGSDLGKAFAKYGNLTDSAPGIVTRVETPPGHRYAGDETPYWGLGGITNPLIQAGDNLNGDCEDSIFRGQDYDLVSSGDCDGTEAHYESCQVFKTPYQVREIRIEGATANRVEVVLRGRLVRSDSAPASVSDLNTDRDSYLATDQGPRTDENTVIAVLNWYVDGRAEDVTRIGDISPNATTDYNSSIVRGSFLCRFGMQRLMPQVWNDLDQDVQLDRDRRAYSDLPSYAEFILRASVGGFLDEERVRSTLTYVPAAPPNPAYCDNQDSRDWTMPNLLSYIGSSDDRVAFRKIAQGRGGYGNLPYTKMYAEAWTEFAKCLNELKASRFDVPIYLQFKTLIYWDFDAAEIEESNGFYIARRQQYKKPQTLRNNDASSQWDQGFVPFDDYALAYMTIWNGGNGPEMMYYWREVHWRMRPHPLIIKAVPEILREFVDSEGGIALPWLYKAPSLIRSHLKKEPEPGDILTDVSQLITEIDPAEGCEIGQSGVLEPSIPPNGDIVTDSLGTGNPGGTQGDGESYSEASMHIHTMAESYIRVPVK